MRHPGKPGKTYKIGSESPMLGQRVVGMWLGKGDKKKEITHVEIVMNMVKDWRNDEGGMPVDFDGNYLGQPNLWRTVELSPVGK